MCNVNLIISHYLEVALFHDLHKESKSLHSTTKGYKFYLQKSLRCLGFENEICYDYLKIKPMSLALIIKDPTVCVEM